MNNIDRFIDYSVVGDFTNDLFVDNVGSTTCNTDGLFVDKSWVTDGIEVVGNIKFSCNGLIELRNGLRLTLDFN